MKVSNKDLKETYENMHKQGSNSWFDDGAEERQAIIEMGHPWQNKTVMEIGCGEGELLNMLFEQRAVVRGCDYSLEAITSAKNRYPYLDVMCCDWTEYSDNRNDPDVLVMQGVLEHLDDWQFALDGMILKFKPKVIITSMPCHNNIRGILWKFVNNVLGGVMSKTDLHDISPMQVKVYARHRGYKIEYNHTEHEWANGCCWENYESKMTRDLRQRLPLALRDGNIKFDSDNLNDFLDWLDSMQFIMNTHSGAVAIYKISL